MRTLELITTTVFSRIFRVRESTSDYGNAASSRRREFSAGSSLDQEDSPSIHHIWWQPPSVIRVEQRRGAELTCIEIVRADVVFKFVPQLKLLVTDALHDQGTVWERVDPPVGIVPLPTVHSVLRSSLVMSPSFLGEDWMVIEEGGSSVHTERPTRRVRARRLRSLDADQLNGVGDVWERGDECLCDIDQQLNIALRLVVLQQGEEIARTSVEILGVDADFPQDIFTIVPPPDTRVMTVVKWPEQDSAW
ncbi:hypothetical protein [Gemmatimonas sp.]|uniref:hypothetical protein n=1 Tax=Gemmatimonas sp. TaxID=1962908 RepID=UPI00286C666F|nr:hypothetical protein [Gemmatimonas sp.]